MPVVSVVPLFVDHPLALNSSMEKPWGHNKGFAGSGQCWYRHYPGNNVIEPWMIDEIYLFFCRTVLTFLSLV
jgi:hypothetical protein